MRHKKKWQGQRRLKRMEKRVKRIEKILTEAGWMGQGRHYQNGTVCDLEEDDNGNYSKG